MKITRATLATALLFCSLVVNAVADAQPSSASGWIPSNAPFRALSVASDGSSIWACGTDEGIAVSADGGEHWQLKHRTPDGNLLLDIQFADGKFGYAAGTGGSILITEDGGESWVAHSGPNATILQISFSDPQHGIIRTPDAVQFTADGGRTWSPVAWTNDADILKTFPYTYSLVTIDAEHMAVMLKQGAAQYEPQTFMVSSDGGKSWQHIDIPSVTLYSFLPVHGKYWAVGTEVVGKDQPGGGHAVPVALTSSDGIKWTHSNNDLSACGPEMCVACTPLGCLSSNGTIAEIFGDKTTYRTFPPEEKLTTKWAATYSAMCFSGSSLECARVTPAVKPTAGEDPVPAAVSPGPLGAHPTSGPHCISCEMDHILVDPKAQGLFTVALSIAVARDGTVTGVEANGAPTPQIKARIEQQAQQWLFEPYMKDGTRVNLKLNTRIQVSVVHPR